MWPNKPKNYDQNQDQTQPTPKWLNPKHASSFVLSFFLSFTSPANYYPSYISIFIHVLICIDCVWINWGVWYILCVCVWWSWVVERIYWLYWYVDALVQIIVGIQLLAELARVGLRVGMHKLRFSFLIDFWILHAIAFDCFDPSSVNLQWMNLGNGRLLGSLEGPWHDESQHGKGFGRIFLYHFTLPI